MRALVARRHGQVAWSVGRIGADAQSRFRWADRGGQPVNPPARYGFGSVLIKKSWIRRPVDVITTVRLAPAHRAEAVAANRVVLPRDMPGKRGVMARQTRCRLPYRIITA